MRKIETSFSVPTREAVKQELPHDVVIGTLALHCIATLQQFYQEGQECPIILGEIGDDIANELIAIFQDHDEGEAPQWKVVHKKNAQGLTSTDVLIFSAA